MSDFWFFAGPIAVAAVGWFIASEISRLRASVEKLNSNQTQMAIAIGRLEEKMK